MYIDLALALYVGLAVYALLAWREGDGPAWFWLAALCLGLAAAVKHLGLVAVMLLAVAVALDPRPDCHPVLARMVRPALIVGVALLLGAPWDPRAWYAAGNPVFPELFDVFGASPALRWTRWPNAVSTASNHDSACRGRRSHWRCCRGRSRCTAHDSAAPSARCFSCSSLSCRGRAGVSGPVRWLAGFAAGYLAVWASPFSELPASLSRAPGRAPRGSEQSRVGLGPS